MIHLKKLKKLKIGEMMSKTTDFLLNQDWYQKHLDIEADYAESKEIIRDLKLKIRKIKQIVKDNSTSTKIKQIEGKRYHLIEDKEFGKLYKLCQIQK